MKLKILLFSLIVIHSNFLLAQNAIFERINKRGISSISQRVAPFTLIQPTSQSQLFGSNNRVLNYHLDMELLNQTFLQNHDLIELEIPSTGNKPLVLQLVPVQIFSNDFKLTNSLDEEIPFVGGKYFHGVIKGDPKSVVSICFWNNEITGILSESKGNKNLEMSDRENKIYSLYNEEDLNTQAPQLGCFTDETDFKQTTEIIPTTQGINCKVVNIYVEADNKMYVDNGSNINNVANYVSNLFNQTAMLYNNENIGIRLSGLKVWDTPDPYVSLNSPNSILSSFRTTLTSFNGNLAHFISTRPLGGGVAYLDVLCSNTHRYGVSTAMGVINSFPAYSWAVYQFSHELGHNFGSPHTHSCTWPGGAIDNCYTPEGSCSSGPTPSNGGTIMSYCHLVSAIRINYANGFGTLPGNLIRNRVNANACLVANNQPPFDLEILNTKATKVTLAWSPNSGGTNYTIQFKKSVESNWNTQSGIVGTIATLGNLEPNINYDWRVSDECSQAFSTIANFTTSDSVYCVPAYSNNGCSFSIFIKTVNINNQQFNSGCSPGYYSLGNTQPVIFNKGDSVTVSVSLQNYGNGQHIGIWIDYNKDFDFTPDERVFFTTSTLTSTLTAKFKLPDNLTIAQTRMRIRDVFASQVTDPCAVHSYGETEDYLISIVNPCPNVVNLVSPDNNIANNEVTIKSSATNGEITASNSIDGNSKVVYEAGKSILLNQGFIANTGTVFTAQIGGCQ